MCEWWLNNIFADLEYDKCHFVNNEEAEKQAVEKQNEGMKALFSQRLKEVQKKFIENVVNTIVQSFSEDHAQKEAVFNDLKVQWASSQKKIDVRIRNT